jgi:hypothetical protein
MEAGTRFAFAENNNRIGHVPDISADDAGDQVRFFCEHHLRAGAGRRIVEC